jgi:putative endonuclease
MGMIHPNKFFVYAISSLVKNYIYVGLTDNLDRRINQHNRGYSKTTKPYLPFKIVLTEEFETRELARKREIFLKSGIGKEYLRHLPA